MAEDKMQSRSQNIIFSALTLPRIAAITGSLLTSLLLIEISQTFGTPIGMTNQIKTANSIVAIITALTMGVISVRYNHKSLLLFGISLGILSTLGCFFAPSFITLAIAYSSGGLAFGIIFPMSTSLIGEYIIPENRSKVLGWMIAGNAAMYLIGPPIINYIGDWRQAYLIFALPIVVCSLILCSFILPPSETRSENVDILSGIKGVFSNKSALSSLIGYGLNAGVFSLVISLFASFYREQINVSLSTVSIITSVISLFYMIGALSANKIILKIGCKRTAYSTLFLIGLSAIVFFFITDFYVSALLLIVMTMIGGVMETSCQNLNLGQLPDHRSSMMSTFSNIGTAASLGFSGFLLIEYGWSVMGAIVGVFGVLASLLVYSFVSE